jgi:glycolate oxidase
MFVGSEGTFGVTSDITVRLIGYPEAAAALIAVMPDAFTAGRAVSTIIRRGFRPRALELMDRASLEHVRSKSPYRLPEDAGAIVLLELDGEADALDTAILRCGALCEEIGATEVIVARDDADRERLWQTRRMCSRSLRDAHRFKQSEDIVVPTGSIAEMLRRVDAMAARHGFMSATFGHAGDGNLHVNLLSDEEPHDPAFRARVEEALADVFRATLDLGGTLSGEHGIGISKARYMSGEQSPEVIDWQKRLKRLWDPAGLLNPGKIFGT